VPGSPTPVDVEPRATPSAGLPGARCVRDDQLDSLALVAGQLLAPHGIRIVAEVQHGRRHERLTVD